MNQMEIFKNPEFGSIRAVEIDGEPWLVGKDVALALGYKNAKDALSAHVDAEDKRIVQRSENTTFDIPNRGITIINESGLYSLVLSSKLPKAKQFRRWVTSEVLPSIRSCLPDYWHKIKIEITQKKRYYTVVSNMMQILCHL